MSKTYQRLAAVILVGLGAALASPGCDGDGETPADTGLDSATIADVAADGGTAVDAADVTGEAHTEDPRLLTNIDWPCSKRYLVGALPEELGHLAAARLTPRAYPFEVTKISYELAGPETYDACDDTFAHRVEIWVETTATPSATPTLHETIDVSAQPEPTANIFRKVTRTLATPLTLTAGQHLYVAVELQGETVAETTTSLCIEACADVPQPDRNFWSNAVAAPYSWMTLADAGLDWNYTIEAW